MGRYIYKPSGTIVEVGEGSTLPASLYEPVEVKKVEAEKPKAKRPRKAAKQD